MFVNEATSKEGNKIKKIGLVVCVGYIPLIKVCKKNGLKLHESKIYISPQPCEIDTGLVLANILEFKVGNKPCPRCLFNEYLHQYTNT